MNDAKAVADPEKHNIEVRNMVEMVRTFNQFKNEQDQKVKGLELSIHTLTGKYQQLNQKYNLLLTKNFSGGSTSGDHD